MAYDIKVGRCNQLNEYMKLYEYQRSRSFIYIGPNHSDSIFLNFFSSITTLPIEAKFYVESPWNKGTKACSNCLGHMIKMGTMPIYGRTFLKSSSLESKSRWPWNMVGCIAYLSTSKFIQTMPQGWPWPILLQDQIWSCMLLYRKKLKQWIFQKLLLSDINVGSCSQLKWVHEA